MVPRPRRRHHPAQRLCRNCLRHADPRQIRSGSGRQQGLPPYIENSVLGGKTSRNCPLVIQDKIFVGPDINAARPRLEQPTCKPLQRDPGSLWYAHTYDEPADGLAAGTVPGGLPLPDPSVIPEFFGDTMLVNGTAFPETTVQARRYRLRMLNACNARFLNLQLYIDDGSPTGSPWIANGVPTNTPFVNAATGDSSWLQIGTEGGFLSKPAKVPSNVPFAFVAVHAGSEHAADRSLAGSQVSARSAGGTTRPDRRLQQLSPGTKVVSLQRRSRSHSQSGTTATTTSLAGTSEANGLIGRVNPAPRHAGQRSQHPGPHALQRSGGHRTLDPPLRISTSHEPDRGPSIPFLRRGLD